MAGQGLSRRERIRRQRGAAFKGRQNEVAAFRANLALGAQDGAFQFVFHVHGNGGVGKTSLVRRWEEEAHRHGAVTAYVDDGVHSAAEAMEAISAQLGGQGVELKGFEKWLGRYRERRHEADGALVAHSTAGGTGGGQGQATSPVTLALTRAGLAGVGMVPGLGPFVGAVDAQQAAQLFDRARSVLSARFRSPEDVQLVLSPERVLTPVFVEDLAAAASNRPWVVLFFDTWEQTGPLLDAWLRDTVLEATFGELPLNVVVVLAGPRTAVPRLAWSRSRDTAGDLHRRRSPATADPQRHHRGTSGRHDPARVRPAAGPRRHARASPTKRP